MGSSARAIARRALLVVSFVAFAIGLRADSAVPSRPDDKAIVHVLNRLGFGPRPGDIERVRSIGLAAYIDQQLHPERISDTQMAARLAAFSTLMLSTRELANDYFIPAMRARRQGKNRADRAPTPEAIGIRRSAASRSKSCRNRSS